MTNADILARPDVIAALQCWWDETRSWAQGVTSSVVADLLDEYGYSCPLRIHEYPVQDYMRSVFVVKHGYYPGLDLFERAAGVFNLSAGTPVTPTFRNMAMWLLRGLRSAGLYTDQIADRAILTVNPTDADRAARSREVRDYLMHSPAGVWKSVGLPKFMYRFGIAVYTAQTLGKILCTCGDHTLVARTMP